MEQVTTDSKYGYTSPAMFFRAVAGERNRITVARPAGSSSELVLTDAGAGMLACPCCRAVDAKHGDLQCVDGVRRRGRRG